MKNLTEIVRDHKSLDELLFETGGELTSEESESIIDSWMAEIKSDLEKKADNYEFKKIALEKAIEALSERADKFKAAAKTLTNLQTNLKERMKEAMTTLQITSITGICFTYKLSNSKASVIIDETKLPAMYMREKLIIEPDKEKIRTDLELGREIDGAYLKPNFSIRTSVNKGK